VSRLSVSLKAIETDKDRSAMYDFLLVIHSNHGPISYRFRYKRRFLSKIANFSIPVYLMPPLREFPLEFCNGHWPQKNDALPDGGKSLLMCAFVSIQYQRVTDGQTDGYAITVSRCACIGMLTRDKNSNSGSYLCPPLYDDIYRLPMLHIQQFIA